MIPRLRDPSYVLIEKGSFLINGPFSSSDFWPTRTQPCLPTLRCSLGYLDCPGILPHSKIPPSALDNVSILSRCSVKFLCTLWPSLFQLRECFLPADLRHSPVNFLSRRGWFVLALILLDVLPLMGSPLIPLLIPLLASHHYYEEYSTVSKRDRLPSQAPESFLSFPSPPNTDFATFSVTDRSPCMFKFMYLSISHLAWNKTPFVQWTLWAQVHTQYKPILPLNYIVLLVKIFAI